jgi:uncharacterized repeat protein (TIGR03803 family)
VKIIKRFRASFAPLLLLTAAAGAATTPAHITFRVVSDTAGFGEPYGLAEISPGLFYSVAAGLPAVFSVTSQGKITGLAGYPNGNQITSILISGPNDRLYSSVSSNTWVSNMFSVGRTAASSQNYPSDGMLLSYLAGNLPDGTFFGTAGNQATDAQYLIKADTDGNVTTFYQFPNLIEASLDPIFGADGNYYGVAWDHGGGTNADYVYRVTPAGSATSLYNLPNGNAGYLTHFVPLIQANDGNFYGVTSSGGKGYGTLYRLTPGGQYTLLHSFSQGAGAFPHALLQASDGNLYGATLGYIAASALFRMTLSGEYTVLHVMSPNMDGTCQCNLIQGSDGVIYGSALNYGPGGLGTIFALDVGLPKPAPQALEFGPHSGPPGTRVRIWGYNLLRPSVQFGAVTATSVSASGPNYVWATVPAGTTSGPITVTTPGGTSITRANFQVQ